VEVKAFLFNVNPPGEPGQDQGSGLLSHGAPDHGGGRRPGLGHQQEPAGGRRLKLFERLERLAVLLPGAQDQRRRPVTLRTRTLAPFFSTHTHTHSILA